MSRMRDESAIDHLLAKDDVPDYSPPGVRCWHGEDEAGDGHRWARETCPERPVVALRFPDTPVPTDVPSTIAALLGGLCASARPRRRR